MKYKRSEITWEIMNEFLYYDCDQGILIWKYRDREWFNSDHACNVWNAQNPGKEALGSDRDGYKHGGILGVRFAAHRVIFALHHGKIPDDKMQIDHIDGNRKNNRIENLRMVTPQENCKNLGISVVNNSGYIGVHWDNRNKKWRAMIRIGKRAIHLGRYWSYDQAVKARREANIKYGFHPNHGLRNSIPTLGRDLYK